MLISCNKYVLNYVMCQFGIYLLLALHYLTRMRSILHRILGSFFDLMLATRIYTTPKSVLSAIFIISSNKTTRVFRAVRLDGEKYFLCRYALCSLRFDFQLYHPNSILCTSDALIDVPSSDNSLLLFNWL